MKKLIIPLLLVVLSSCGTTPNVLKNFLGSGPEDVDEAPKNPVTHSEIVSLVSSNNEFARLLNTPEIETLVSSYKAAKFRYQSTEASQGFIVSGSGDFGARNEKNNEAVAVATLTAQKSLDLQSENSLSLEILEHQQELLLLDIRDAIDNVLAKVMAYELSGAHLERMRAIYDNYKSLYQQNRAALDAAISAGVINSSENFKFRKTLANYDRKIHDAVSAHELLKLNVQKYIDVVEPRYVDISSMSAQELALRATSTKNVSEIEKLNRQASILLAEKSLLEAQKKPQGSMVSRLTSPASADEDWSAFLGVNIILPIYDGGEKDLLVQEKIEQSKGVAASINSFKQRNADAQSQLERYLSDAETSLAMLAEEQSLSNEIIEDLKTRLGYGGASISDLVSEMLVLAELEFQVLDKQRELRSQALEYAANFKIACALTKSCDAISGSIENIGK